MSAITINVSGDPAEHEAVLARLEAIESLVTSRFEAVTAHLNAQGARMADAAAAIEGLRSAVAEMKNRVDQDVDRLRQVIESMSVTEVGNREEIARLRAEGEDVIRSITEATAQVQAIDPVADEPTEPTDAPVEPEPVPADPDAPVTPADPDAPVVDPNA